MTADLRPPRRVVDPEAGKGKVEAEGRCRICLQVGPLTRHHLVPRSLGGDDLDSNIVPLCGSGVTGCHGKIEAASAEHRRRLRRTLLPEEVAYVDGKKGRAFLNRYYPAPRMTDPYGEVAAAYVDFYEGSDSFRSLLIFGAAELLRRGGTVLDVGCGPGIALDYMPRLRPLDYLGIDPSPGMIEQARRDHPGYRFICARFEDATPRRKFDLVLSAFGPLFHVEDLERFARAVYASLMPAGRFLVMGSDKPGHRVTVLGDRPHQTYYHAPEDLLAAFPASNVARLGDSLVVYGA